MGLKRFVSDAAMEAHATSHGMPDGAPTEQLLAETNPMVAGGFQTRKVTGARSHSSLSPHGQSAIHWMR